MFRAFDKNCMTMCNCRLNAMDIFCQSKCGYDKNERFSAIHFNIHSIHTLNIKYEIRYYKKRINEIECDKVRNHTS